MTMTQPGRSTLGARSRIQMLHYHWELDDFGFLRSALKVDAVQMAISAANECAPTAECRKLVSPGSLRYIRDAGRIYGDIAFIARQVSHSVGAA